MSFQIINADITALAVDAIVNPTDRFYSGIGGTDRAVHLAAGQELDNACNQLPTLAVGNVAVTKAYQLPCKYVLHTVGPIWQGGDKNETMLLRSCYVNALLAAKRLGLQSIAFPLISSGAFGFPKDQVLKIALDAIRDFYETTEIDVTICVFDRTAYELSHKVDLERFLSGGKKPKPRLFMASKCAAPMAEALYQEECCAMPTASLDEWLKKQDDTFAVTLLKLIDKKGMTDVECYKKAQVTKNTFWKINNNPTYHPSKQTAIAFAIALELSLEETEQFLKTVGYSLSHSSTFDMIIEYYITKGIYDLFEINAALYRYDQICLGC